MTNTKTKFFHLSATGTVVAAVESETGCIWEQLELARAWNKTETRSGMVVELVSNNRLARLSTRIAAVV